MDENDNTYKKPSFDGRLQYVKTLSQLIDGIHEASILSEYERWTKLLLASLSQVIKFVNRSEHTKIYNRVLTVYNRLSLYNSDHIKNKINNIPFNKIDKELHEITNDFMIMAGHLLLPTGDEIDIDEENIDWDNLKKQFREESDL